jgi:mono/diheme cytochrome c family protein
MPNTTFLKTALFSLLLTLTNSSYALSSPALETIKIYKDNCAECHNADRLGGMGPALLPQNLKRLRKKAAIEVIKNGRVATQMPSFK